MGSAAAVVVALTLVVSACGGDGDDDASATTPHVTLPGEGDDRVVLEEGIVVVELQSSSTRLTDTLELDVTAAAGETNPSSLFAVCSGLDGGSTGTDGRYRVGVTDLRRLDGDARLLSVEVTSTGRVRGPGEYRAEMLVVDRDQRQAELSGTMRIEGRDLRSGTFSMVDRDNEQVRGTFRCGRTSSDVTTTTAAGPPASRLAGVRVEAAVGVGAQRRAGSLSASSADLKRIDPADEGAAAHCSGVVAPTSARYVARLDDTVARRGRGGLTAFLLEVSEATNPTANKATLTLSFGNDRVSASGSVKFDAPRASGRFRGTTSGGTRVSASFDCGRR